MHSLGIQTKAEASQKLLLCHEDGTRKQINHFLRLVYFDILLHTVCPKNSLWVQSADWLPYSKIISRHSLQKKKKKIQTFDLMPHKVLQPTAFLHNILGCRIGKNMSLLLITTSNTLPIFARLRSFYKISSEGICSKLIFPLGNMSRNVSKLQIWILWKIWSRNRLVKQIGISNENLMDLFAYQAKQIAFEIH